MTPTTADIRRFLVNTFGDEDLKTLCFDYFRDVYDDFTTGMTKGQMIQLLIERCVRRDALRQPRGGAAGGAARPVRETVRSPHTAPRVVDHSGRDSARRPRSAAGVRQPCAPGRWSSPTGWRPTWTAAGWRAWIAPESIQPGEKWVEAMGRGLDGSGVFVVSLTPAAVGSSWVRNETNAAIELDNRGEVQFIPLDVATCIVPVLWNLYQRVSFRRSYEDGLRALLGRLGAEAGEGETRGRGR